MNSENIFFILYDARSGSTYLSNLLVKNYDIVIPPETNFIIKITKHYKKDKILNSANEVKHIIEFIYKDDKFKDWGIEKEILYDFLSKKIPFKINEFLYHILNIYRNNTSSSAKYIGIKKGSYLLFKEKIFDFFPNSKFITIIRDGRAVYNSKKSNIVSSTNKPFASEPVKAAFEWMYKADMIEELRAEGKKEYKLIFYEDIILNTKNVLISIADFLNANENQQQDNEIYVSKERYGNLHENIQRDSIIARINAWKNKLSEEEIKKYELYAYEHLNKYGYECMIIDKRHNRIKYKAIYLINKLLLRLKYKIETILLPLLPRK